MFDVFNKKMESVGLEPTSTVLVINKESQVFENSF